MCAVQVNHKAVSAEPLATRTPTFPKTDDERFARLFEAAGCRTQTELAGVLGIRQSSVSDAKRRRSIPAHWLLKLMRTRGVNPDWILEGTGQRLLV